MKNRFWSLLVAVCMAFVILPMTALAAEDVSGTWGSNITYVFESSTGTLTISGEGVMKEQGAPDWALPGWRSLGSDVTKIVIEEGITQINSWSFSGFSKLEVVELPISLKVIADYAFSDCYKIKDVYYPGSRAQWENDITIYSRNDGLTSYNTKIHFGDPSVENEYCGYDATFDFDASTGFLTIEGEGEMYDYVDGITPWIADEYNDLIKKVIIEEGITYICEYAFAECTNLETIEIPSTITKIGASAFLNCSSLKGSISIPAATEEIPTNAFEGCSSLEAINVHEDNEIYKSIDGVVFDMSDPDGYITLYIYPPGKKDTTYNMPDGTTDIHHYAFSGCNNLITVNIPKTLARVSYPPFYACMNLKDINVDPINQRMTSIDGVLFEIFGSRDGIVYYPPGKTETSYAIPYGFREIYSGAFACNKNLKEVTIPEKKSSNINIEEEAFINCEGLEKITLPMTVNWIGKNAFLGCNNLKDVYFNGTEGQWNSKSFTIGNECLFNATIHCGNAVIYNSSRNTVSFYVDKAHEDAQITFTEYDESGKLISFKLVKTNIVAEENEIESEEFTVTDSGSLIRIMAFENNSVSPIFNRKYETRVSD